MVIAPADEASTKALVRAAAAYVGPVFIRTGRPKAPVVYDAAQDFEIGKSIEVADGSDVTLIANGLLVAQALLAAQTLEAEGISARVIDMHTVKPIDREAIAQSRRGNRRHRGGGGAPGGWRPGRAGGAGGGREPSLPHGVRGHSRPYAESGQPDELLEKYGLVAPDVAAAVRKVVARKR